MGWTLSSEINGLVKMTGEAFVRQRGKKLQIGNLPSMIDVNNIWRSCPLAMSGKTPAEEILPWIYVQTGFRNLQKQWREILLNIFFQKLHDPCGLHIWQIHFLI